MTFTDDDLKRLKIESIENYHAEDGWCILTCEQAKYLIARLEAAEEYNIAMQLNVGVEKAEKAWCKAAGK